MWITSLSLRKGGSAFRKKVSRNANLLLENDFDNGFEKLSFFVIQVKLKPDYRRKKISILDMNLDSFFSEPELDDFK